MDHEPKPKKTSTAKKLFNIFRGGSVVLGFILFVVGGLLINWTNSIEVNQNPLIGIPIAFVWLVSTIASSIGFIILIINLVLWIVINNNRLKNYVALSLVLIIALSVSYNYYTDHQRANGITIEYYGDGSGFKESEGELCNGYKIGKWVYYHYGGIPSLERTYVIIDVVTNRRVDTKNKSFKFGLPEDSWLKSVEEGLTSHWDEQGQLVSQGMESIGNRVGIWKTWYPSGAKESETNHEDHSETHWYENGVKKSFSNYGYGVAGFKQEWNEKGQLISEREYNKDGDFVDAVYGRFFIDYESSHYTAYEPRNISDSNKKNVGFYRNGNKKYEFDWVDGKTKGPVKEWFINGQQKSEMYWVDHQEDGTWKSWNYDGSLQSEKIYHKE
ncbi:hypothetical protein HCG49_02820 [Arenibacter sp. 6A1]|uniref:hypothetical protein n=1 Tax=Arenibacter sp. 6A1 TaxID=2720391 RepID=UPI0014487C8C|nr:hypothetical protein [Arenibacter sp. 6A1]NKI25491.1 hypothetical protein [Arenibacter sp. 6A1]